jgi:hypothetical protein
MSENDVLESSHHGYLGSFAYPLRTPEGGYNMMFDSGDNSQGAVDPWSNYLIPGISPTSQVVSSSIPSVSSSAPTQTPLTYEQTKLSHSDNAARDIPLEKVSIQPRSNEKCITCGLAFQDSTRLRRHESRVHSAPDKRECDLCHALVTGEDGLQRHYRRHIEQADQSRLEYFEEAREKMTRKR